MEAQLVKLPGVLSVSRQNDMFRLLLSNEQDARIIFNEVTKNGFIERFSLDYLSLEDIFKRKVGDGNV